MPRSVGLATLGDLTWREHGGTGAEASCQVIDDLGNLQVRIALTKIRHESRGLGDAKMCAVDERLGGVSPRGVVRGPPSDERGVMGHSSLAVKLVTPNAGALEDVQAGSTLFWRARLLANFS